MPAAGISPDLSAWAFQRSFRDKGERGLLIVYENRQPKATGAHAKLLAVLLISFEFMSTRLTMEWYLYFIGHRGQRWHF
jgi:hypothetical protein